MHIDVPAREAYSSDLTAAQWAVIEPLIPACKHGGRPRAVNLREVLNTIVYLNRTGCQRVMLPHGLLPKSTVYDYFAAWRDDGTWQRIMDALRENGIERPMDRPEGSLPQIVANLKPAQLARDRRGERIGSRRGIGPLG